MNVYIVNCIIEAMQKDGQLGQAWVKTVGIYTDEDEAKAALQADVKRSTTEGSYVRVEQDRFDDDFVVMVRQCEGRGNGTRIALTISDTYVGVELR